MELQEHDIALLEAYLAGELAGEDLRACEARLQAEPALADALVMLRAMGPATRHTAQSSLRQEMKAAKAAAIAAGMSTYQPSINIPKPGSNFLGRLLKWLLSLAVTAGVAWLIWKYVLHERLPGQLTTFETTETQTQTVTSDTTIRRDTVWGTSPGGRNHDRMEAPGPSEDLGPASSPVNHGQ